MRISNTQQKTWKREKHITFSSEYQTQQTTHKTFPPDTPAPCSVPEAPPCYWKHKKVPSCPHSCLIPFGPHAVTSRRDCGISWLKLSLSDLKNNELGNKPNDKGRPKSSVNNKSSVEQSNIDFLVSCQGQATSHSRPCSHHLQTGKQVTLLPGSGAWVRYTLRDWKENGNCVCQEPGVQQVPLSNRSEIS